MWLIWFSRKRRLGSIVTCALCAIAHFEQICVAIAQTHASIGITAVSEQKVQKFHAILDDQIVVGLELTAHIAVQMCLHHIQQVGRQIE